MSYPKVTRVVYRLDDFNVITRFDDRRYNLAYGSNDAYPMEDQVGVGVVSRCCDILTPSFLDHGSCG